MCFCEGSDTPSDLPKYTAGSDRVNTSTPNRYPQDIHRPQNTPRRYRHPEGVRGGPTPPLPHRLGSPYFAKVWGGKKKRGKKGGKKRRGNLAAPPPLPHRMSLYSLRASLIATTFDPTSPICRVSRSTTSFMPSGEKTGTPPRRTPLVSTL